MTVENRVDSLNDLTPAQLEIARGFALRRRGDAVRYLQGVVDECTDRQALGFVDEVLLGSEDAATWGQTDVLVTPTNALLLHLRQSAPAILRALGRLEGQVLWRIQPRLNGWPHGVGAPGVLPRRVSYRWQPSEQTSYSRLTHTGADRFERVEDAVIGIRRWIASRCCWEMREHHDADVEGFLRRIGLSQADLSPDGASALDGLRYEITRGLIPWERSSAEWTAHIMNNPAAVAPGFLAEDDAYR